jgi:catecholate siderophore receptor
MLFPNQSPVPSPAAWLPVAMALLGLQGLHAGQDSAAPVHGQVLDQSGSSVVNAQVNAVCQNGALAPAATGEQGQFSLESAVPPCTLTVAAGTFLPATAEVSSSSLSPVVIRLQIAPASTSLTITEAPDYLTSVTSSATRTATPLRDIPQSITVVDRSLMRDQLMASVADVVRYTPGVTAIQGENNRDQVVIRGNSSSADFFVNGVRDDVQYYRDLYNVESVEALKGPSAMIFGRGGGGGVINRVTKAPGSPTLGEVTLQAGSFGDRRFTVDLDRPLSQSVAARLNSMYEASDSFRNNVHLQRYALNPVVALAAGSRTRLTLSYEYLHDGRVADRGTPSFAGRPVDVPSSAYFGNPADSWVRADVNLGSASLEHQIGHVTLHSRTLFGDYDRGYQNYVPGAVSQDRTAFALSAYNNATWRRNFFNQTDFTRRAITGPIRHTLVWGAEAGRQRTANYRNTGYFDSPAATSIAVPLATPETQTPAVFLQSASDANNSIGANVAAGFLLDQVELSRFVQIVAGVRLDRFSLNFLNRRTGESLTRPDTLLSPRLGVVLKPAAAFSLYASNSVSWLPSSGDQFSSLTTITQQVKPEKFTNYETGVKWDVRRSLALTVAAYRLDRTNTRATDPNDPTRIVQTGSQRTTGVELGVNGSLTSRWRVAGGYAWQDAFITSPTTAARSRDQVAQVPHRAFSIWNNVQLLRRLSAGVGLLNRGEMFAAIDNSVTLPGYTRADAAIFFALTEHMRFQANCENLLDRRYTMNADGNNNISPGAPRSVRAALVARF